MKKFLIKGLLFASVLTVVSSLVHTSSVSTVVDSETSGYVPPKARDLIDYI